MVDAGLFQGGAVGSDQTIFLVDPASGDVWEHTHENVDRTLMRPGPGGGQTGFKWPAFRGDGFIYALGQSLLAIDERYDGGVFQLLKPELADAGALLADPFGGLVVTTGALVAIPSEYPDVLLLIPDAGQSASRGALLSPFFNKL